MGVQATDVYKSMHASAYVNSFSPIYVKRAYKQVIIILTFLCALGKVSIQARLKPRSEYLYNA